MNEYSRTDTGTEVHHSGTHALFGHVDGKKRDSGYTGGRLPTWKDREAAGQECRFMEKEDYMMPYTKRGRNFLTKQDKEEIKRRIQAGERAEVVAGWYNIAPFTAMKIAGVLRE